MSAVAGRVDGAAPLRIEGDLTIYTAAQLRLQLMALLAQPGPIEIDLSAVQELDCAGLQLLIAAGRAAQASGSQLRLVRPSEPVVAVLESLGLAADFADTRADALQSA